MKVLIIGSGGREHAIAWKISQSPLLSDLFLAPGNDAMSSLGKLVPINVDDSISITEFAIKEGIDLVIIGPEVALSAGVSDRLRENGIAVFGPSQAAARIETSKSFSKEFMQRHQIPTAKFRIFKNYSEAKEYISSIDFPFVIKASGLAAGKGVILPETSEDGQKALHEMMISHQFGSAGDEVVIEELLVGEEVSLLAFSDGKTISVMPPAQDHKRLLDDDQGPNTGGMGAFAPAMSLTSKQIEDIKLTVLQPVIDGLRQEGTPYIGVLYAGLILTQDGIKVLEFNARFGDPETQVILPLLKSDLLSIILSCTNQKLNMIEVKWSYGSAVCVVLASGGYPEKSKTGFLISGLEREINNGKVFHAGTRKEGEEFFNTGGRVLGVTCWDDHLKTAIQATYKAIAGIQFDGMQYRRDIAFRGIKDLKNESAYKEAGVNIDAGNRAVELMKSAVQSTYSPEVLAGIGSFGGLYDGTNLGIQPVLVASTDGVGTKVELAARLNRYRGIGEDIVNHCIDDILVQGARPLFFLDYFATDSLNPEIAAEIVTGMADACRAAGCVLLGGETAEMPGVYQNNAFDVAGTIVGVVERNKILPKHSEMSTGDCLLGLASSGPHTNGFSLIRKLCEGEDLASIRPELKTSLADALLSPHKSYLDLMEPVIDQIMGLAHITGGGFLENIPRMLPDGLQAVINLDSWNVPPLFQWLQRKGKIEKKEMFRVFNMGIGFVAVVKHENIVEIQAKIPEMTWVIGELQNGDSKKVILK